MDTIFKESDPIWKQYYKLLIYKFQKDELTQRAAAVAFSFTLSLFPLVIFLFSIIPYIPVPHIEQSIMSWLQAALPEGIYRDSEQTIRDLIHTQRAGLLSIGFILTLYASTSGMMELMTAFERFQAEPFDRHWLVQRLIATGLLFVLALGLIISSGVIIVGELLINRFSLLIHLTNDFTFFLLQVLRFGGSFLVLMASIAIIFAASSPHYGIRKQWSGAFIGSVLIILLTKIFSYYLANFASYNKIYGSLGTFIAMMVWLNLVAMLIMVSYEFNIIRNWISERNLQLFKDRKLHRRTL